VEIGRQVSLVVSLDKALNGIASTF